MYLSTSLTRQQFKNKMFFRLAIYVIIVSSILCKTVSCLTCLSCASITEPRHCHTVVRCSAGEVCGAEKLNSSDGSQYLTYKLGCASVANCGGLSANGTACNQCCSTHLCNAALCGEPDYPASRGPICYDCPFHTDRQPCRHIEFCSSDEECGIVGVEEFGEVALRSSCRPKYSCPAADKPEIRPVVGKRSALLRSAGAAVCDACCSKDLCNLNCSAQNQCSFVTCRHGNCVSANSTTVCHCFPGWRGNRCDQVDHCSPSPCLQGSCTTAATSYTCSCFMSWKGTHCDTSEIDCDFEVDTCSWTQSRSNTYDWYRTRGATPSSGTGPSGDHTTGSGYYMYIEASSGVTGSTSELVSQLISPHNELCMELAYNMYGSQMGSINIYIKPESKTKFIIQHLKQTVNSQAWIVRNFTIPTQTRNYQIVIEGVKGTGIEGDAAIDDIKLYPQSC